MNPDTVNTIEILKWIAFIGSPLIWGGMITAIVRRHDKWILNADKDGTAATRVLAKGVEDDADNLERLVEKMAEHSARMDRLTERLAKAEERLAVTEARCSFQHPDDPERRVAERRIHTEAKSE